MGIVEERSVTIILDNKEEQLEDQLRCQYYQFRSHTEIFMGYVAICRKVTSELFDLNEDSRFYPEWPIEHEIDEIIYLFPVQFCRLRDGFTRYRNEFYNM